MSDRETPQTAAYVRSLGKVALKPAPGMRRTAQRITVAKAAARANNASANCSAEISPARIAFAAAPTPRS